MYGLKPVPFKLSQFRTDPLPLSEIKPVSHLGRDHPRIVPVEPADGHRVIQQHAVIGHVDRRSLTFPSLAERVAH